MVLISYISISKGGYGLWAYLGNFTSGLLFHLITGLGLAAVFATQGARMLLGLSDDCSTAIVKS